MIKDIINMGIKEGDTLNLKVSMRAIGNVRAEDLISALLSVVGQTGTIVAESFVRSYHISELRKYKHYSDQYTKSYAGALANAMIYYPGVVRSTHPIMKFTAIGARAVELTSNNSYAYDVLKVMAHTGGKNLNIGDTVVGVGTTHVAIGMAGLKQIIPKEGIYYDGGLFLRDWAGGCAEGFSNFDPYYNGKKGKIGNANAMLTDMGETLSTELAILKEDPAFFMCGKCIDCRYSWEFSKGRFKRILLPLLRTYNRLK